jgi:hypothetical protein
VGDCRHGGRRCGDPSSLSPCGRGWIGREAAETGEGYHELRAEHYPSSVAAFSRATLSHKGRRKNPSPDRNPAADGAVEDLRGLLDAFGCGVQRGGDGGLCGACTIGRNYANVAQRHQLFL